MVRKDEVDQMKEAAFVVDQEMIEIITQKGVVDQMKEGVEEVNRLIGQTPTEKDAVDQMKEDVKEVDQMTRETIELMKERGEGHLLRRTRRTLLENLVLVLNSIIK